MQLISNAREKGNIYYYVRKDAMKEIFKTLKFNGARNSKGMVKMIVNSKAKERFLTKPKRGSAKRSSERKPNRRSRFRKPNRRSGVQGCVQDVAANLAARS